MILKKLYSFPPKLKDPETLPNVIELLPSVYFDSSDTHKTSWSFLRRLIVFWQEHNTWFMMELFKM